jgi:hypothetical protein
MVTFLYQEVITLLFLFAAKDLWGKIDHDRGPMTHPTLIIDFAPEQNV